MGKISYISKKEKDKNEDLNLTNSLSIENKLLISLSQLFNNYPKSLIEFLYNKIPKNKINILIDAYDEESTKIIIKNLMIKDILQLIETKLEILYPFYKVNPDIHKLEEYYLNHKLYIKNLYEVLNVKLDIENIILLKIVINRLVNEEIDLLKEIYGDDYKKQIDIKYLPSNVKIPLLKIIDKLKTNNLLQASALAISSLPKAVQNNLLYSDFSLALEKKLGVVSTYILMLSTPNLTSITYTKEEIVHLFDITAEEYEVFLKKGYKVLLDYLKTQKDIISQNQNSYYSKFFCRSNDNKNLENSLLPTTDFENDLKDLRTYIMDESANLSQILKLLN